MAVPASTYHATEGCITAIVDTRHARDLFSGSFWLLTMMDYHYDVTITHVR